MKKILAASAALALCACGGGGSGGPEVSDPLRPPRPVVQVDVYPHDGADVVVYKFRSGHPDKGPLAPHPK